MWLRTVNVNDAWGQAQVGGPSLDALFSHLASSPLTELGLQGMTALATFVTHAGMQQRPLTELRLFGLGDAAVDLLVSHHDRLAQVDRIVLEDGELGRRHAELSNRFGGRLRRVQGTFAALEAGDDLRYSIFDAPGWK